MAGLTLAEVAAIVEGKVVGDPSRRVEGLNSLEDASPRDISFLGEPTRVAQAVASRAGALLMREIHDTGKPAILVGNVRRAVARLAPHFHVTRKRERPGAHPYAVLGERVVLGDGVGIGPFTRVDDECIIGRGTSIAERCSIGSGTRIGEDVVIHPGVTVYPGTQIGNRAEIHAGAVIGVDGFSIALGDGPNDPDPDKIPSLGAVQIADDVEIFANVTIARGSFGKTMIGRGTKVDCLSHIAHNCRIGPACVFAAFAKLSGSVEVGEGVVFGGDVGAIDHIQIGPHVRVGASSALHDSVPAGAEIWGRPARPLRTELRLQAILKRLPDLWGALARAARGRREGEAGEERSG